MADVGWRGTDNGVPTRVSERAIRPGDSRSEGGCLSRRRLYRRRTVVRRTIDPARHVGSLYGFTSGTSQRALARTGGAEVADRRARLATVGVAGAARGAAGGGGP